MRSMIPANLRMMVLLALGTGLVGCGNYRALCLQDATATRLDDDRVQAAVVVKSCGLGEDMDWPEGEEYCVQCVWRAGETDLLDEASACDASGLPLGQTTEVLVESNDKIPADPAEETVTIEVTLQDADWPGYQPLEIECP